MLNLKKVILGLGLLGVVSSANATYLKCGATNQVKYIETAAYACSDGSGGDGGSAGSYNVQYNSLVAFPVENGVVEIKRIMLGGIGLCGDSYTETKFLNVGEYISKRNFTWKGEVVTNICQVMAGDLPNSTTSNPEIDALKARLQTLESKVYQCVQ